MSVSKETFSRVMGELDDKYIEEAIQYRKKKIRWLPVCAAAACICLIAGSVVGVRYKNEHPWPVKTVAAADSAPVASAEVDMIPHWEDMPIYQQFHDIAFNDISYSARRGVVPTERLGESLGTVTARGWDEYAGIAGEDANRYINAELFTITKINPECAIAVRYEGHDTVYACVNSYYRPETLGQFVEDLNLLEEVSFGTVYYEWRSPAGRRATIWFDGVDDQIIKDMLLTETNAENVYDESKLHEMPKRIMGVSVNIPLLGYQNISLSVQEDGYLKTNILDTGKLFYIGEDNTQAFVDYVTDHCEGYEPVTVYSNVIEVPETQTSQAVSTSTVQNVPAVPAVTAGAIPSFSPAAPSE